MKIFITGESGTGKTTLGRNLKQKGFNIIDIDEDNLCHWVNKETQNRVTYKADLNKNFINAHVWVCDINNLSKIAGASASPIFIIGMPENIEDIIKISDKIILLKCKPETFLSRITQRTDNDFGKDVGTREIILNRHEVFERQIEKSGAVTIDTDTSEEKVLSRVLEILG